MAIFATASWRFCSMPHAMERLFASPKTTATRPSRLSMNAGFLQRHKNSSPEVKLSERIMEATIPSRTALRVALRRAAHQIVDSPLVFEDPVAVPILGHEYAEDLRRTPVRDDRPFSIALRALMVARSRYAEDKLRDAIAAGVRQYVLLGAGLDTFAYRNPWPELRVFEVDHPATQQWKRDLLHKNRIAIPQNLPYVPVDFEQ